MTWALDPKHPISKNQEDQFSIKQKLKDEIEEKNYTKELKKWGLKLKYKINFIFNLTMILKRKINLVKAPKKSIEWGWKLI